LKDMAEKKYPEQVTDNAGCVWTHNSCQNKYVSSCEKALWASESYVIQNLGTIFTPVEEKPEPVYRLTASQLAEYGGNFHRLTSQGVSESLRMRGIQPEPEQPQTVKDVIEKLREKVKAYSGGHYSLWPKKEGFEEALKMLEAAIMPQSVELREVLAKIDEKASEWAQKGNESQNKFDHGVAHGYAKASQILKRVQMPQPEPQTGFSKTKLMEYLGNYPEQYSRLIAMIGNGEFDGAEARN